MHPFPFAPDDWDIVSAASLRVVNATLADDEVLRASCFIDLQEVIAKLRTRYGEHPVLLETEADFTADTVERICLYERAKALAVAHQLPTVSIRLELARLFLEELQQPAQGCQELIACQHELALGAGDETSTWHELMAACKAAIEDLK